MKLLVIDGNSIANRAYYGIRHLAAKDGTPTNAVYGFLSILLRLKKMVTPDAIAVAFDVHHPTFRHEMYDGYKAGRHGMEDDLRVQMPIIKEILGYLGATIIEKPGFEADDILGTLSMLCKGDDVCYLATGDRDSFQLISDNTNVLFTATKMGEPITTIYDKEKLFEDYGMTPDEMIVLKSIMGDSSDNIPGVPGIGQKGATDLVSRFKTLDYIYENLETIDIKKGIRAKLEAGKESAYLSLKLGTICKEVPLEITLEDLSAKTADTVSAIKLFARLEMFGMIEKFDLSADNIDLNTEEPENTAEEIYSFKEERDLPGLLGRLKNTGEAYFIPNFVHGTLDSLIFVFDNEILLVESHCFDFDEFVKTFFESAYSKYSYDVKQLYKYAIIKGYELKNVKNDVMLCGYILNPSSSDYSISRLAQELNITIGEVDVPSNFTDTVKTAIEACTVLKKISQKQLEEIKANEQEILLNEIELPLAEVLASMECTGFLVSRDSIYDYGKQLESEIELLKKRIFEEIGIEFNLNSPKQLGQALFETLGLPAKKKTKTGYSTNAEVLEELSYSFPVVSDILRYRTLSKLKSTYCDGLIKEIEPDGRIRSTLNQVETRTGRISSLEPNLQNIPARTPEGKEIRKFFIADEGRVLVDADYSQIELRVLAHISGDKNMTEAFNNGDDIHTITASQVFNMPLELVTPLLRSRAKAVNFGIVYGIGAFSLSKDIGVSVKEADRYIKDYLLKFSGIDSYMKEITKDATEKGYAQTLFHRRRYLPELRSSNKLNRAFGERVARNMPIQGTAADIIKIAMIRVFNRLKAEFPSARLIMQVHDELIVECDKADKIAVSALLKEEMENATKMNVALLSDVHSGKTWYESK